MGTFVGAEYLIANALIALGRKGVERISFQNLREFGISVQKKCITENVDAVFLVSSDYVNAAIFNFSDYFAYEKDDGVEYISINRDRPLDEVKKRFMGFIQPNVLGILIEQASTLLIGENV